MEEKSQSRLEELYFKKLTDFLSEDESFEMLKLLNQKEAVTSLSQLLYGKWKNLDGIQNLQGISDEKIDDLFLQLHAEEEVEDNREVPTLHVHRVHFLRTVWFRYAAAIILLLGSVAYFWITNKNTKQTLANGNKPLQADIEPGTNKAILTLADGSTIILDTAANGELAQQGNAQVIKLSNGAVAYNLKGIAEGKVMMNTMSTPRGGQYQLILPDGSKVWLNAESSITYPAAFANKERKVKITGEVYMEVAKNKVKPFIVDVAGKSSIEVLGTSFNVNSYADESVIKTTLVEGSVKIIPIPLDKGNGSETIRGFDANAVILKPGQQAAIQNNNTIKINNNADLDQAIAWKNGVFNFNGDDLQTMMRQLARWYDIEIVYTGKIKAREFDGKLRRDFNLSEVLEILKELQVNFKMEGRKLLVMP